MKSTKTIATVATLAAVAALGLAACSSDDSGSDSGSTAAGGDVNMTFWHNSTTGEGKTFWEKTVADFEAANPGVKITIQAIQNEDLDGKLQTALNSGDAPDIFMQRGGGKLADMVAAGQVMDISGDISSATKSSVGDAAFSAFSIDNKVYAMPTAVLPGGIFYSSDLFKAASIATPPTTIPELNTAVTALKGTGVAPIALGAKDAWPAAHWFYFFSLRECSQDTVNATSKSGDFSDKCWLKAATDLQTFAATNPFNDGFLTTSAQQGAGSSAGLVANHQAAMELMGGWDPGVIASLTPDQQPLPDLEWFPFPEVEGGQGTPGAMMGGVDGFSCSATAPKPQCTDFLNFFMQKQYQEAYATAFHTVPASKDAQGVVTEPALKSVLTAYNKAPYVILWLDTLLGQNIGNALNTAVVDMLAGKGDPQSIVDAANNAAAKG